MALILLIDLIRKLSEGQKEEDREEGQMIKWPLCCAPMGYLMIFLAGFVGMISQTIKTKANQFAEPLTVALIS
jgi:hypothetical protein